MPFESGRNPDYSKKPSIEGAAFSLTLEVDDVATQLGSKIVIINVPDYDWFRKDTESQSPNTTALSPQRTVLSPFFSLEEERICRVFVIGIVGIDATCPWRSNTSSNFFSLLSSWDWVKTKLWATNSKTLTDGQAGRLEDRTSTTSLTKASDQTKPPPIADHPASDAPQQSSAPKTLSPSVLTTGTPGDGSTSTSATAPHAFDVSYSTAVTQRRFRSDADDDDRSPEPNASFHEESGATVAEIFYERFLEPFGFSFERDDSESTETFEKLLLEFLKGSDFPDVLPFPYPPLTSRNTKTGGDNESKRCTQNYSACVVSRRWK